MGPTRGTYRGVILCVGMGGPLANEMRVVSKVAAGSQPGLPETQFEKRSAEDWFLDMPAVDAEFNADAPQLRMSRRSRHVSARYVWLV